MILRVRRSSGFPIMLESFEQQTLDYLEQEGRLTELENYERELRSLDDGLRELTVEAKTLAEVHFFIESLKHVGPIVLDFSRGLITILDTGDNINQ